MTISRSLLLKCLGGVAACFGTASLGIIGSETFGSGNVSSESETELNNLLEKVGLSECTVSGTTECSIGSPFNVQQGTTKEEGKSKNTASSTGTPGKIKVYSNGGYSNGYKFLIEEGNITLTGTENQITELKQYETYEIKEEDGSWYFSRKKKAGENIRELLGLPDTCNLVNDNGCSEVEVNNSNISTIKFDGLTSGQSATLNGNAKLTITKLTTSDSDFPFDYKFELKASSDSTTTLNINSKQITLQQNTATEFRIKKGTTGNTLTLEEAWSLNNLLEKVSLSGCTVSGSGGTECTIGSTFNVQHNSTKEENKTKGSSSGTPGKIKVYSDTNYNKGFKFLIEDGDITLTGSGSSITKLEEFETYEIKKESDNKWYFSRKKTSAENIRETLGLPTSCTLGNGGCSEKEISTTAINSMKFDGVSGTPSSNGNVKLTVTKETTDTAKYPLGYKFTFKAKDSTSSVNLTLGDKTVTLGTNEEVEFKIKKSGSSLSLEESGSLSIYLEKVGLSVCTTSTNSNECTIGSGGLKVEQGNGTKEENKTKQNGSGKIKVYKENSTDTYNKGYRFEIEDGDITLSSGTISKLEQFETYEIKEDASDSKWYFSRKKTSAENIKDKLGLPENCNLVNESGCSEVDVTTTDIAKIKFDGVTSTDTPTLTGSTKLTVTKESTNDSHFPYGYKFTFKADASEATIKVGSKTITIKANNSKEFRIKKSTSDNSLFLEEAWTKEILLEKVGLECSSDNTCTVKNSGTINIKQDSDNLENKSLSNSDQGKIKLYTTDDESYNKGFKFVIEEKDISITSDSKKLEQFETYEIKDEGEGANKKWYFSRKTKAADEIKKALGLPTDDCTLPTTDDETTCSNLNGDKLKNINFKDKGSDQPSIDSNGSATLTITKVSDTTTYPLGYKFVFNSTENITISSSASKYIKKNTNTEFKIEVTKSSGTTPVKLSLEKSLTAKVLGQKVGLSCQDSDKKCDFTDGSINVKNDNSNDKIEKAKVKEDSTGKKMTYEEDQEGYNQGLKFYLEESDDITLTSDANGGSDTSGEKKIHKKGDSSESGTFYEIKEESGTWYLTKKGTTSEGGS